MKKLLFTMMFVLIGTQVIAQEFHPDPYKVLTEGKIILHQGNQHVFKDYDMPELYGVLFVAFEGELFTCGITEDTYLCSPNLMPRTE
tara:strand:- start:113 stop:373 length:261 start_codon:yes stop_codon:yes gene_type:complete